MTYVLLLQLNRPVVIDALRNGTPLLGSPDPFGIVDHGRVSDSEDIGTQSCHDS